MDSVSTSAMASYFGAALVMYWGAWALAALVAVCLAWFLFGHPLRHKFMLGVLVISTILLAVAVVASAMRVGVLG